jgi:hypothetical protein
VPAIPALVLGDFGTVTGWGDDGPPRTADLSPAGGIVDIRLDGATVRGVRSVPYGAASRRFVLDLRTGRYL